MTFKLWCHAVPRKAAGDVRAYERVETEPGLDKFVDDPSGDKLRSLKFVDDSRRGLSVQPDS